ncbi:vitamin B12-dependent ribonucleotide reductase [Mycoplasmatota bacterium]|nr:vitamin B12-dependent ribonucleotide reductase [Mycoplasmatota bacterium]
MFIYPNNQIKKLNKDIKNYFPHVFPVTKEMNMTFEGVSRLVMLDRYTQKDINHQTIGSGDLVICIIKEDPKFPSRGIGYVIEVINNTIRIQLEEEYIPLAVDQKNGIITRKITQVDKPIELYFEQIAKRVANNLAEDESQLIDSFYEEISSLNIVPAGRVLFGAGSDSEVTYFNCFVMPFIHDSRGGISKHREHVMEIMSRGGGVGTNGSTLRPKNALARGVNGKSSGSVSWLNDLSSLTNLVEQGGSRRGAQMIMLANWHPDIIEFIISKMQNPKILQFLIDNIDDEDVKTQARNKLKFIPLKDSERDMYSTIIELSKQNQEFSKEILDEAELLLAQGGRFEVQNPEFLTGANISVAITEDFMYAVENDLDYDLRFPDVDNYDEYQKSEYNRIWQDSGDVREWEKLGFPIKTYKTIKAKDLWNLINICATYAAEPGIFFLDNANKMTNATGYGQKVVCTNPCGEQPLAPYSVCNLAAINLANMVNKEEGVIDYKKLEKTIRTSVRLQDNVIDKTSYFLEENKLQAQGERRVGMGIMGLHDLLIWCGVKYGSKESLQMIDGLFEFISTTAYRASIDLAKEKGSFPFLEELGSREKLIQSGFIQKLPKDIQEDILTHGIRNSHLLTIAPTGSTGTMVGVSTGLEPYFAFKYYRSGRLGKHIEVDAPIVEEFGKVYPQFSHGNLPDYFVSANDLSAEGHADVQCVIQRWVDSSISKTVNAPKGTTVSDVERLYYRLYKGGAKGGTVYVDGSRDAQVLSLTPLDNPKQIDMVDDFGVKVDTVRKVKEDKSPVSKPLRQDRQGRDIGAEIGDICPICNEGTIMDIGGCNTCNNCNAQLKCGL